MSWKSFSSWSVSQIVLIAIAWVASVIGYVAVRSAVVQQPLQSSADEQIYVITVHVHHPILLLFGPPLLLCVLWFWRRSAS